MLNRNGAKTVLVMAKKCLERAEDIFVDIIDKKPLLPAMADHPPPLPARGNSFEECKQSNGTEQTPTVRLVV